MSSEPIKKLIQKYTAGNCNESESALIEAWYNELSQKPHDLSQAEVDDAEKKILFSLQAYILPRKYIKLWSRIIHMTAASIFICIGIGLYFYQIDTSTISPIINSNNDIAPGGNKAYLTLADGKRIALTDAKTGEIAKQSGVQIFKMADGQLSYSISKDSRKATKESDQNTIETPKGGQYRVNLPDGTKVWLNAASSLRYPMLFAKSERRVELSGEAYFEVSKDKKHPFIVKTDKQDVEVLGTHFNINSYTDEPVVKTTLMEGSVRVILNSLSSNKKSKIIKPGQQSQITSKGITIVDNIDLDGIIAWKDGYFSFNQAPLEDILKPVSRWYNVNVEFKDLDMRKELYSGEISKFSNISQVLNKLEKAGGVKFKIDQRKIIVIKN